MVKMLHHCQPSDPSGGAADRHPDRVRPERVTRATKLVQVKGGGMAAGAARAPPVLEVTAYPIVIVGWK